MRVCVCVRLQEAIQGSISSQNGVIATVLQLLPSLTMGLLSP